MLIKLHSGLALFSEIHCLRLTLTISSAVRLSGWMEDVSGGPIRRTVRQSILRNPVQIPDVFAASG